MKTTDCMPQKISKTVLVSLLGFAAVGLVIIGVTILPIFGFILAIPIVSLAIYIYQTRLNDNCEIDFDAP